VSGGYGDGIMRSLSGSGFCGWVNGYHIPLVGRVSMDSCIFDASDISYQIAQDATQIEFFGLDNPITYIAECAKTISYEFLTNLSKRAKRIIYT
jgi:alanine racemase